MKTGISKGRTGKEQLPYMNIDVQAPPDDFESVEGMCGNWNGKEGEALRGGDGLLYTPNTVSNFSQSWKYVLGFIFIIRCLKRF